MLIDVGPMNEVVLGEDGLVTIGAGARLGDVYDALDQHGLTIPAGCGPDVGIAGLVLGGGLGILGRRHGLTADALRAAEIVAGRRPRACECDDELLWALRGGGSRGFGVVTSLTLETAEAPRSTAFVLEWPAAAAAAVLERWQEWAPDAPDELAASLLVNAPADPAEPLVVKSIGAMCGTESETAALLAALGGPGRGAASGGLGARGEALPVRPRRGRRARPAPQPLRVLRAAAAAGHERRADRAARGRPRARRGARAGLLPVGRRLHPRPGRRDRVPAPRRPVPAQAGRSGSTTARSGRGGSTRRGRSVHPHGTGGVYPNFPDPALEDPGRAYYGANLERLLRVKAAYDPDGFFPFP